MAQSWRNRFCAVMRFRLKENLMAQVAAHQGFPHGAITAHGAKKWATRRPWKAHPIKDTMARMTRKLTRERVAELIAMADAHREAHPNETTAEIFAGAQKRLRELKAEEEAKAKSVGKEPCRP
jgi:hypothetical protein